MNAALLTLLKAHSRARLRRLAKGFSTTRRTLLSLLVLLLGCVWTGQTVASMLLRDPYSSESFRRWVTVPLFGWTLWHLLRVAWKRPERAIEWSGEEEDQIVAGPFSAQEQLAYRFAVILTATLPKAMLTILVLWPDLTWISPVGLVTALVGLEMFRMLTDIAAACLNQAAYQMYRFTIIAMMAAAAIGTWGTISTNNFERTDVGDVSSFSMGSAALSIDAVMETPVGQVVSFPFRCAADVISGQGDVTTLMLKTFGMLATLVVMAMLIVRLDAVSRAASIRRERRLWRTNATRTNQTACREVQSLQLPRLPFYGPVIWRQAKRARRFAGSLLVSMAIPACLLLPPVLTVKNAEVAFFLVVGSALFYTFVLLPEAIKFDFRLDCDHMSQLKLLPITASRIVLGQLTVPVVLACSFQVLVFAAVGVYRSVPTALIVSAASLAVPLTVLFVSLDNLVFLLYPHRPTQEGFEAFIRTILKFTAKTLLMTLFLGCVVLWAPLAAALASALPISVSVNTLFCLGIIFGIGGLAAGSVSCVIAAFRRFDVSLHSVA